MFGKKLQADVKKSTQKIQDSKKDSGTRFKHLRIVLGKINLLLDLGCAMVNSSNFFIVKLLFL